MSLNVTQRTSPSQYSEREVEGVFPRKIQRGLTNTPTPNRPTGQTVSHPRYILRFRQQTSHNVNCHHIDFKQSAECDAIIKEKADGQVVMTCSSAFAILFVDHTRSSFAVYSASLIPPARNSAFMSWMCATRRFHSSALILPRCFQVFSRL